MQQYFECTIVLKRYKAIFSILTFWKAPGCDRQKYNLRRKWAFDEDARDMVEELAGIKSINSSVVLVSWSTL